VSVEGDFNPVTDLCQEPYPMQQNSELGAPLKALHKTSILGELVLNALLLRNNISLPRVHIESIVAQSELPLCLICWSGGKGWVGLCELLPCQIPHCSTLSNLPFPIEIQVPYLCNEQVCGKEGEHKKNNMVWENGILLRFPPAPSCSVLVRLGVDRNEGVALVEEVHLGGGWDFRTSFHGS